MYIRPGNALACVALVCGCTCMTFGATRRVPQDYSKVQDAVNAAASGDVIEISSGTYITSWGWAGIGGSNLTIRGVGPTRPVLDARHGAMSMKGIFLVSGTNITIENIEFMNCRLLPDDGANGSAIRMDGTNLTVRNCYFHDCDNGIMGAYNTNSDVLVEHCEFNHCGHVDWFTEQPDAYSGYSHNMYIGTSRTFTLRYCYSHAAAEGHTVKTRALANNIYYNLLTSEDGTSSRELQFAQGGVCYAVGNVIIQGQTSHNSEIICYGGEGTNSPAYLYVVNNTIINQLGSGVFLTVSNNPTEAVLRNNIIQRLGGEAIVGGSYAGKVAQAGNWVTNNAWFRDAANHNYRLTAASTGAIDLGTAPGTGRGVSLTPAYQYVFPYADQARPSDGAIDIGAYEYTPNGAPAVDAGADLAVAEGREVSLHAAGSDPDSDVLSYAWTQPTGLNVVLTGMGTADLSFAAPTVHTLAEAAMSFTATVTDGQGGQADDSVNVRVYMLGDVNQDDTVDVVDLLAVVGTFGLTSQDAGYDAAGDLNGDGSVDVIDLMTLVDNWGRELN